MAIDPLAGQSNLMAASAHIFDAALDMIGNVVKDILTSDQESTYTEAPKCQKWQETFSQITYFDFTMRITSEYKTGKSQCSCSRFGPDGRREEGFGYTNTYFWSTNGEPCDK